MTTKSCGTCEFWDKKTEWVEYYNNELTNHCGAPLPDSLYKYYKDTVMSTDGKNCAVYKKLRRVKLCIMNHRSFMT